MCQNVCRMCVECVLCVFPCVLTRYSFYCDIVICGAIWAAAGAAPIYGAALSEDTLYSSTLVTPGVNIQEDEIVTFFFLLSWSTRPKNPIVPSSEPVNTSVFS